ncbi:lamin tail domain-containing protein [Akkermansiaceae bacterium]|nr:lamin tail domain-containing protein [bacterium]MDB4272877.1 lamin tail domain-containing protein [Akkermansiaceae bacterium]MDB4668043.1 lamin tail domain-containing protein [Akkermansiaceae bacterium]MDB4796093.1 lamin tail domain-containing protein [Akkermansiaceae bacterium]
MKVFLLVLFPLTVSADLVITEAMPNSRHINSSIDGDWWELTNNGATAMSIGGYSWDDSSNLPGSHTFPAYNITAGESVIILDEPSAASIAPFRAAWGLPSTVKIFTEADFGSFSGLGGSGDTVNFYLPGGGLADSLTFSVATPGSSFADFSNGSPVPGNVSEEGLYGADKSNQSPSDIGSPGAAAAVPGAVAPEYFAPFEIYWPVGRNLNTSEFRAIAVDPNPADTVSVTVISKPTWLTLNDLGNGVTQLSGTPTVAEIGPHTFELEAADDSGVTDPSRQVFTLNILPELSPIILNEYNAVGPDIFLDGAAEGAAGAPSDAFFGQVAGNGGEWLEFVIFGDGTGPTMDMRGGSIEIISDDSTRILKLSDSVALSEIPIGTILTFSETVPTEMAINIDFKTTGYSWSNIWMYDPILIDQAASTHPAIPAIGSNNTRVLVRDPAGELIYGPSGESVGATDSNANGIPDALIAVNDTEVYKLEQNPTNNVDPLFGLYDDGATSTFGKPNKWSNETMTQSFAPFIPTNAPPYFSSLPGAYATGGSYDSALSYLDPESQSVTITSEGLPDFLTIVNSAGTATIQNNRPLTVADIGTYDIVIIADDGSASLARNYHPFRLTVVDPAPAILLNEYNAVSDTKFLNGGTAGADTDGLPNASDNHFGRIAGNGGDWFELVVIGDGGAGTTDLRGWKIEIGKANAAMTLVPESTVTFSQNENWSAVRNGTILTFTKANTAAGGLNTDLNREDRFDTEGWGWSNVYLGDTGLLTGVDLAAVDIDSNNFQFRISNSADQMVFGPVGEGVIPDLNVGSEEIFELEADPSTMVGIADSASGTTTPGYDDSSSSSTFGAPNIFLPAGIGEVDRVQDFSAYVFIPSTYASWASDFGGVAADDPANDFDNDGWSNFHEYLFGGIPNSASSFPSPVIDASTGSVTTNVRVDDPNYTFTGQRCADLVSWVSTDLTITDSPSPLGASFKALVVSYDGPEPKQFFRVITE